MSCYRCTLCLFSYIISLLLCRLTIIFQPSLWLIWLSRNLKRWQLHMWMPPSRLGDFDGGTHLPMSKPKTNSLLFFLFARKSSITGFTKLLFGHMYSNPFLFFFFLPFILCHSYLNVCFLIWKRVLRLRLPLLKMNSLSTSTGLLQRMFCSLLILSSIGG